MYQGHLTKMDADDAFAGNIASLNFDLDFTMVPNAFKTKEAHPDYVLEGRSPRGRVIRIGSAWSARSRMGNDYFSLALNLPGEAVIRANAVKDTQSGEFRIIPLTMAAAA